MTQDKLSISDINKNMAISRQIQQHGMSIWSKPSIIFVIMLFIGAGVQYNEYLNVCLSDFFLRKLGVEVTVRDVQVTVGFWDQDHKL